MTVGESPRKGSRPDLHPGGNDNNLAAAASTRTPSAFLDHVEPTARSRVAGMFYGAVRGGQREPAAVCRAVWQAARGRGELALLRALRDNRESALGFAAYVVRRERAPLDERRQLKAEAAEQGKRGAMARKPATQKQLDYLRRLGHRGAPPASMLEASNIIDALLRKAS